MAALGAEKLECLSLPVHAVAVEVQLSPVRGSLIALPLICVPTPPRFISRWEPSSSCFRRDSSPPTRTVYRRQRISLCLAAILGPIFSARSDQELLPQTIKILGSWVHSNLSTPIRWQFQEGKPLGKRERERQKSNILETDETWVEWGMRHSLMEIWEKGRTGEKGKKRRRWAGEREQPGAK